MNQEVSIRPCGDQEVKTEGGDGKRGSPCHGQHPIENDLALSIASPGPLGRKEGAMNKIGLKIAIYVGQA